MQHTTYQHEIHCKILTNETVCALGLLVHFVPYDVKMKPLESHCEAQANILQIYMNHWVLWFGDKLGNV